MISESISSLFHATNSQSDKNDTLSSLFSDSNLKKFARVSKLNEFSSKKVPNPDSNLEEESDPAKVNPKKKDKKRKPRKEPKVAAETSELNDKVENTGDDQVDTPFEPEQVKIDSTIFIGNISLSEDIKSIRKFCKQFGEVESVRLRSIPMGGVAVDDAGNQDLVRKVCSNSRVFGDQKGSFNAYVVFKSKDAVPLALQANNQLLSGRHIRIDTGRPSHFDSKLSIFLGNLPHYADEEELREHFAKVLPNKHDDIEGIRLVRDPATLIGKGIGFMLFKDRDAVLQALSLHGVKYKNRFELRVTTCGKRTKRTGKESEPRADGDRDRDNVDSGDRPAKKPRHVPRNTTPGTEGGTSATGGSVDTNSRPVRLSGTGVTESISIRKGGDAPSRDSNSLAALNAQRRINLKSHKSLQNSFRGKGKKDKKTKRLGGVLKRAMKTANSK